MKRQRAIEGGRDTCKAPGPVRMGARSEPRAGFTLIEMLVVIAILGVLLGILLPSLSSARQHTYAVKCATNLKQIGVGWSIYAQNSNEACVAGRMPNYAPYQAAYPNLRNVYWVGNGEQYRPRWYVQLGAESGAYPFDEPNANAHHDNTKLVDSELFICPTRPEWVNNRNYTYGYNYQFLGNARLRTTASSPFDHINFPVRTSFISHAGSTVLAADSMGTAATFPEAERSGYNETGQDNQLSDLGNHGWALDPPRLTGAGSFSDGDHGSGPDPRHDDEANFLFVDTHVEPLLPEKVGYRRMSNGAFVLPGPVADPQPHNRSFSGTGRDDDPPAIAG